MKKSNVNVSSLLSMKEEGKKISVTTCYDYSMARLIAASSIDMILVGDSGGMVNAGYDNTLPVTLDEMLYYTRSVARGAANKFIIADMPFLSYHVSTEKALEAAGRLLKEGGAHCVKLEGGAYFAPIVEKMSACSIPVCGHLGMTPQSIHNFGGFKLQGKSEKDAVQMLDDAKRLEDAGVFALVLELIPEELAQKISKSLTIPTIGIGAGRYCDGQVLVINDILGMDDSFSPKMVKKYANLAKTISKALEDYNSDIKNEVFPGEEHSYKVIKNIP